MSDRPNYWFPAQRFGWGWGFPVTWQGWGVLAVFVLAGVVGDRYINFDRNPVLFSLYIGVLIGALITIMLIKGEPPSWRWGNRE